MGNIGSGTGSGYPAALDYQTTPEVNFPSAGMTKARAQVPNDLVAAVIAVETELGTDPAGTVADVKTFLQTGHNANGTHKPVGQLTDGTNTINTKIINIGDWNMSSTGTQNINVAHGVTLSKIRNISVIIRNDVDTLYTSFIGYYANASGANLGYNISADGTNIILNCHQGLFYSTDYDATSYNRGWITIIYID